MFDIVVVGAGPAGLAGAVAAAGCGRTVGVLDDNPEAGGQIWRTGVRDKKDESDQPRHNAMRALEASGAELLTGHRVIDVPEPGLLQAAVEKDAPKGAELIRWRSLIVATGARERFLPFPGWTLPGVFGAGGLQALVKGGLPVQGKRILVAGTGPLLLAVAAHLKQYGGNIVCVAEQASYAQMMPFLVSLSGSPGKLLQGLRYRATLAGTPYRTGCWPVAAEGDSALRSVRLSDGKRIWTEVCDYLACGFHLVPNTELAQLLGCGLQNGAVIVDRQQRTTVQNVFCAGEPTGIAGLDAALVEGEIAGYAAASAPERTASLMERRDKESAFGARLTNAFRLRPELRSLSESHTIVCRCEDVPYGELRERSGWSDAKLQTRCGMGSCQGRICGAAVEALFGWQPGSVRPPIFPIPIADWCDGKTISNESTEP